MLGLLTRYYLMHLMAPEMPRKICRGISSSSLMQTLNKCMFVILAKAGQKRNAR